ncbi:MAG: LysM peptidoglycan-binding domain-containing protein [Hormoscilla sp. GUM202]|nr:LysM peptidoglycan-binding domain-containing protein [Hormoscilla sp. GM7CHS1pb]MBO1350944.1 LysM peptidoglycan-binding domain-containing protein [Hormoscilla sp. GUM202]
MLSEASRYYNLETANFTDAEGRIVAYKRRRFLPQSEKLKLLLEVTVTEGDRLDAIANKYIGSPEMFWQLCDANNTMNPFDLAATPGKQIRVPQPDIQGNF